LAWKNTVERETTFREETKNVLALNEFTRNEEKYAKFVEKFTLEMEDVNPVAPVTRPDEMLLVVSDEIFIT
jgi:hypothetical protein